MPEMEPPYPYYPLSRERGSWVGANTIELELLEFAYVMCISFIKQTSEDQNGSWTSAT